LESETHDFLFFETFCWLPQKSTARVWTVAQFTALHADPGSDGPFHGLSGHWSGTGTITMTNGGAERIRCKAAYAVNGTGKAVQQTLRCASDNYMLEISSNVIYEGGSLSGSWAEATRGVSGNISGRASGLEIVANVAAAGFTARLDVRTQCDSQSVTIRPQGGTDV
jgi:hypothetical protein